MTRTTGPCCIPYCSSVRPVDALCRGVTQTLGKAPRPGDDGAPRSSKQAGPMPASRRPHAGRQRGRARQCPAGKHQSAKYRACDHECKARSLPAESFTPLGMLAGNASTQGAVVEVGLAALVLPPATNFAATTLRREVDGIAATVSAAGLSDDPPTFRSHGCQRSTARPAQTSRGYGTGCDSCLDLIISRAGMLSSVQRSRDTGMLNRLAMRFDLVICASLCNGALLDPRRTSKLSSKSHRLWPSPHPAERPPMPSHA